MWAETLYVSYGFITIGFNTLINDRIFYIGYFSKALPIVADLLDQGQWYQVFAIAPLLIDWFWIS